MTYIVTVTSQGQISIPAPIRRKLRLDKSRLAIVRLRGDEITIKPVKDILDMRGIFKTDKKIDFKETRKKFEEALARGEA